MATSQMNNLNNLDPAIMARFFSTSVIREMAKSGRSETFARIALESGVATAIEPSKPIREIFDAAFRELSLRYRNEHIYKTAIARKILLGRHSLNTAVMMTEFRVASTKADVVILNGSATAYEIKSELDNLERLPAQIEAYLQVFARVCVISSDKHSEAILKLVPPETGVLRLTNRGSISSLREPVEDPTRIVPTAAFEVLRIQEAKMVLCNLGIDVPEIPNTKMYKTLKSIFKSLSPTFVHSEMVKVLKTTRKHNTLTNFLGSIPYSLHAVTIASNVKRSDQTRLTKALDASLGDAILWS